MIIQGRRFVMIGSVCLAKRADGTFITQSPQRQYLKAATTPLHHYGAGEFCTFRFSDVPDMGGVYTMSIRNKIMYVGETDNLKRALNQFGHISPANCYDGGRQTMCRINQEILDAARNGHDVEVWFCACDDRKEFKVALKSSVDPSWNL